MSSIEELARAAGIDSPKDGDVVLGCAHKPDLGSCHIFLVDKSGKGGMQFTDGLRLREDDVRDRVARRYSTLQTI